MTYKSKTIAEYLQLNSEQEQILHELVKELGLTITAVTALP